ncbi:hypothetical protein LY76DRAFT_188670 [Colletotrichum caudatum]|nr:hypothetical protein LY76DRAFT_188670 [Colletotrichum caudatum]
MHDVLPWIVQGVTMFAVPTALLTCCQITLPFSDIEARCMKGYTLPLPLDISPVEVQTKRQGGHVLLTPSFEEPGRYS